MADVLLQEPEDGVATITLNRPEVRNAAGNDTWPGLEKACDRLELSRPRAVVLTGAGGAFCAGGDLKQPGPVDPGVMGMSVRLGQAHRAMQRLRSLGCPVVAAVAGPAVGVGWGLALACDLVVAEVDAHFSAPFVQRGLVPDGGIAWHLTRVVGPLRATDLLLSGRRVSAEEALELGLVSQVVAEGEAVTSARIAAEGIAASSSDAVRLTRRLVALASSQGLHDFLDEEQHMVALNGHGPDPAEGRRAFLEGRAPDFRSSRRSPRSDG